MPETRRHSLLCPARAVAQVWIAFVFHGVIPAGLGCCGWWLWLCFVENRRVRDQSCSIPGQWDAEGSCVIPHPANWGSSNDKNTAMAS